MPLMVQKKFPIPHHTIKEVPHTNKAWKQTSFSNIKLIAVKRLQSDIYLCLFVPFTICLHDSPIQSMHVLRNMAWTNPFEEQKLLQHGKCRYNPELHLLIAGMRPARKEKPQPQMPRRRQTAIIDKVLFEAIWAGHRLPYFRCTFFDAITFVTSDVLKSNGVWFLDLFDQPLVIGTWCIQMSNWCAFKLTWAKNNKPQMIDFPLYNHWE